ncbi:Hist_deacetyl domain-containing protein [Meloidogyne graminicola]|uniref:Hist_deacetyl domain-containing protein n=1 Tax=Meloidogyne graminicola TaxID=189291 RepID=A0A8T0A4D2_9BILA|nr:Hist_deacetyl domain-containing protein [Meloidogyne graminicola]
MSPPKTNNNYNNNSLNNNFIKYSSSITPLPPTFFVTDRRMLAHKNEWDPDHIDTPKRLEAVLDMLEKCSLLAVGSALKAMEAVLEYNNNNKNEEKRQQRIEEPIIHSPNSFAAIRPPGHHASAETSCGFCIFNNVAICAKKARQMGIERVFILDWDVHAGQGTQYCIEGDPGILLVSAHRYENGQFWPELVESDIINEYKNTINVPLNEIGYGDAEYSALMHFLVLPLIQQWQPGLILVSCGFDAGIGDPQGEMEVSPAGFGYMTSLLAQLGIPLCLVLEGGYFLESVVQGTRFCIQALLNRTPPVVNFCNRSPSPKFLSTLYNVLRIFKHQTINNNNNFNLFNSFLYQLNTLRYSICSAIDRRKRRELTPIGEISNGKTNEGEKEEEFEKIIYFGDRKSVQIALATNTYPTRGQYPPRVPSIEKQFSLRLKQLNEQYYSNNLNERTILDLKIEINGKLLLLLPNGIVNKLNGKELVQFNNCQQFLIFYYYVRI